MTEPGHRTEADERETRREEREPKVGTRGAEGVPDPNTGLESTSQPEPAREPGLAGDVYGR